MLHSTLDMASGSTQNFVKLTLDLNSPAFASGVLSMLSLVAGTPDDYDLQLRVLLGKQVLGFAFTGIEVLPALFTGGPPDLAGSTMTPEVDAHQSVEDDSASVEEQVPSFCDNEDAEFLDSDEPGNTQKK
jgi:hypothetical protein